MTLKKYKMHMVVANELLTRKDEVVVVTSNEKISVCRYKSQVGDVVENPLIRFIVETGETFNLFWEAGSMIFKLKISSNVWYNRHLPKIALW